ncbi:hypothetical protein L1987_65388 [Smallanthus sonchifolius]|uniref:Uncharacterized protein n=1 Tax=Smallanthus sonchifolius TaxID=185202 RepID=A0ACB9BU63_9ASTR|nr:hypothetical protein L1987_65388 [Smallanthus sonchifolius]
MGIHKQTPHTHPSSSIHHHSSSSDFQFTISLSPPNSSTTTLRPADELFFNGQVLPLHLVPRNSMVRTLTTTARSSLSSRPISISPTKHNDIISNHKKPLITKQFSFNKFSSVFRKVTFTEKIRKYMKKLSQFHDQKTIPPTDNVSYSFSGNLRFLTKTNCVSSCPSTMPPSPKSMVNNYTNRSSSSTEELQSAIQGAIAHCKNSMTQ